MPHPSVPASQPRRAAPRSGQRAIFLLADGRSLEICVPGAIGLSCSGFAGESACVLRDQHGDPLVELANFAEFMSQKTA
ncbi:MAG TPA: hypothetical protein VIK91_13990 [Nannocystis sp.]